MIDTELLSILVCPLSRKPLLLDGHRLISTDPETRRAYRIDKGIPVLLVEEGDELPEDEWKAVMQKHGKA